MTDVGHFVTSGLLLWLLWEQILFYVSDIVDTLNLSYSRVRMESMCLGFARSKRGEQPGGRVGGARVRETGSDREAEQGLQAMFGERGEPGLRAAGRPPHPTPGAQVEETFT